MRQWMIPVVLFICISVLAYNQAAAEEASVLLNKYGISADNAAEEGKKLDMMEDAYYQTAKRVKVNTMIDAAATVYDQYAQERLAALDLQIYGLTDELTQTVTAMEGAKEREVAYILELDVRYRAIAAKLSAKRNLRYEWAGQYEPAVRPSAPTIEKDKARLRVLDAQVSEQRSKYAQALHDPELGEINGFRSPLTIPVQMTSGFGIRLDPVSRVEMSFHKGMDLHAPEGTDVLAAFNGTVEEASNNTEIGNYVILNHGRGIKTLYGHLLSFQVTPGQAVRQYEPIAKSGNTGTQSTGPHLHFGVFIYGQAVDPAVFVPHS